MNTNRDTPAALRRQALKRRARYKLRPLPPDASALARAVREARLDAIADELALVDLTDRQHALAVKQAVGR